MSLARTFGIDEVSTQSLADFLTEQPGVFLKSAGWEDEDDQVSGKTYRHLICRLPDNGFGKPFGSLSGSETGAVLLDLAIARAKLLAMHRPTLLIVETAALSMTLEFLSRFLIALSSPEIPFQTLMITTEIDENAQWGGWQIIRLTRPRRGMTKVIVGDVHSSPNWLD